VTCVEYLAADGMSHRSMGSAAPSAFPTFDAAQQEVRRLREQDKQHFQRKGV
jgi:hypothetical protein